MINTRDFKETANLSELLRYLASRGFPVNRRTAYNHLKSCKLRKSSKGTFTPKLVSDYMTNYLNPEPDFPEGSGDDSHSMAGRKLKAETEKLEAQSKRATYELDILQGRYINREDVELEMAGRAVVLEAGFDHMVYTRSAEFIEVVNGDPSTVDKLIALLMEAKCKWFNQYAAADTFMVTIKRDA